MSTEIPETLFRASAAPGLVVLVVDPTTAYLLAAVWEFAHKERVGGLDPADRPRYLIDAAALRGAAHQAANTPEPVEYVPVGLPEGPHLSLVGGESR